MFIFIYFYILKNMGNTNSNESNDNTSDTINISKEEYKKFKNLEYNQQQILKKQYLEKQLKEQQEMKNQNNIMNMTNSNKTNINNGVNNYYMENNRPVEKQFNFPQSITTSKTDSILFEQKLKDFKQQRNNNNNNNNEKLPFEFQTEDLDPFKILDKERMSYSKLALVYKKLMIKNHPDKGGNQEQFKIIIDAYKNILKLLEYQDNNKSHLELKNNFNYQQDNEKKPILNQDLSNNFNSNRFNEMFDKFKFNEDDNNNGYGNEMVESDKNYNDIEVSNFIGKYNKNKFNDQFKQQKQNLQKNQIIEYTPPQPLESLKVNYEMLGENNTGDYGDKLMNTYTDYKKAYSNTTFINEDMVSIEKKTLEKLKNERKQKINLSDEEQRLIEKFKQEEEKKEWQRQNNFKDYQSKLNNHFNKNNINMLNYYNKNY